MREIHGFADLRPPPPVRGAPAHKYRRQGPLSLTAANPRLVSGGHCPVRALAIIPEAIHLPRGLSLFRSWSDAHGPHLTFTASEDIQANGHGGPATHDP